MIFVYIGAHTSYEKALEKKKSLIKQGFIPYGGEIKGDSVSSLQEFALGQGLFGEKQVYLTDSLPLSGDITKKDGFLFQEVHNSPNALILYREKIGKEYKDLFKNIEVDVFEEKAEAKKEKGDFSLTDRFNERDKKGLWITYITQIENGATPEEIHGMLYWNWKNLVLVKSLKTYPQGEKYIVMHPFVLNKTKRAASLFKEEELKDMGGHIISMFHDAHRGKVDFTTSLERFILKYL